MNNQQIIYQSGAASLFAIHAREEVQNVCPWCLEPGQGSPVMVNGCLVLSDHEQCRAEALKGQD